jgi:hypothetical protein
MKHVFFILIFILFHTFFGCSEFSEPKSILSKYTIGSRFKAIPLKKSDILIDFAYKRGIDSSDINLILKGYAQPKKFLKSNQRLIIVDHGEYAVYLYFDDNNKLVDKEILGT